jgi:hypothetical protein
MNFATDNFNPDGMTQADLGEWIDFLTGVWARKTLLPQLPAEEGEEQIMHALAYCREKQDAMNARIAGNIQKALAHEKHLEARYAKIKKPLRW